VVKVLCYKPTVRGFDGVNVEQPRRAVVLCGCCCNCRECSVAEYRSVLCLPSVVKH
jgi:hypothetical protein